jgi:hypothetical protein
MVKSIDSRNDIENKNNTANSVKSTDDDENGKKHNTRNTYGVSLILMRAIPYNFILA